MAEQLFMMNLEDYKGHVSDLNKKSFTLMSMVLGHDLGLFDVLNEAKGPLTSSEIAERASLKERYVQEWLGAMVAGSVIFIQEEDGLNEYYLPQDYFDIVMSNVALGKGVCECVRRADVIKDCFRKDGPLGDPQAFDGDFWKFFGKFRSKYLVQNQLLPKLDNVEDLHELLVTGCNVLDVGCGNGALTLAIGKQYPNSFFTGIDIVEESIKDAKAMLEKFDSNNENIAFQVESTSYLAENLRENFDVVFMSAVLHNLPDPLKMIEEVYKLLKSNGKLILIEIRLHSNHAENVGNICAAAQYSFSQFFCLPFSMSKPPHQGYGVGWGEEGLLRELKKFFRLDVRFEFGDFENLFVLSKD